MTTIYNGIDPSKYENLTSPEHLSSKFKLDSSRPVVGTIGRLHPIKGQRYFLEAAALVERANPGNQFLVVGSGPLEWELRELAQSLGIGDKVVFTGYYPHIEEVLAVMDIMCLPSLAEGMGLVLLEAMLLGVPIVASRVGGIPELVKDGETGLLVPPADSQALAKGVSGLLRDRNLRAGLRERGRQRFNDFTLDQMLKHTETLYLDVLHERDRH